MMRKILGLLFCLIAALPAAAQGGFTTVTGTIVGAVDGLTWSCGSISAQLITAGGAAPTLNGGGFTTQTSPVGLGCPTTPGTGANGSFAMRLADSGVIVPSNTTWRFTINMTPGIAPPAGTGPQSFTFTTAINCSTNTPNTCTSNTIDISALLSALAPRLSNSTSGSSVTAVGTAGTPGSVNPSFYGAKYDGHFCAAPTFTNTNNVVTVGTGCPNLTGTDLLGRPLIKVGQLVFGSNTTTDVSQATSIFITPECGVASFTATQITMGVIGSLATPCNATASTAGSGFVFWGDLDSNTSAGGAQSAANDPVFGAWTAAAQNCVPYHHPAGVTFIERQEWNTYPATSACGTPNSLPVTRQGFTITGEGSNASIVIITPNFNPTNECTGPNASGTGCMASLPNPTYHDWQIWGAGNSAGGLSGKSGVLVFGISPGINFEISRMQMNGWGAATAGFVGLNIGNNVSSGISGGTLAQTNVEAFGGFTCVIAPGVTGSFIATIFADSLWCTVGNTTLTVNGGIFNSVNGDYGWTLAAFGAGSGFGGGGGGVAFSCQGGAYCNSTNDTMPYNGTANNAGEFYCYGNSGLATHCNIENDIINTTQTNGIGLLVYGSGGGGEATVQLSNTIITAPYVIFTSGCNAGLNCRVNSVGGNIYTASTTGYTPSTGASLWLSPTDQLTGFGTTVQTGITGTGACSTVSTETAITTTGVVTCTAAGGAATLVLTPLFTAPHGWYCSASDETTAADTFKQTASSTTTCTISAAAVVQNDVVTFYATPY